MASKVLAFLLITLLIFGCIQPPAPLQPNASINPPQPNQTVQPNVSTTPQPKPGFSDEFGCLPADCSSIPAGVGRTFCEEFKAGTYKWAPDCSAYPSEECRKLCASRKAQIPPAKPVTFILEVPSNTPPYETPYLIVRNAPLPQGVTFSTRMTRLGENKWTANLTFNGELKYVYERNMFAEMGGEEFASDFNLSITRVRNVSPGETAYDKVTNWRWFPLPNETFPEVESAAAKTTFAPRINNEKFQRGFAHSDFWAWQISELVPYTDEAMKADNAEWEALWPAWDYVNTSDTSVPHIWYYDPAYGHMYTPEELDFHISRVQKDGLNVFLMPQICCHNPDAGRQYSQAWWDAWYGEIERYTLYFADTAEKHNVSYMVMPDDAFWRSGYAPAGTKERQIALVAKVREHYSGKLGLPISTGPTHRDPAAIFPGEDEMLGPELFDFFAVSFWTGLSDGEAEPSVPEMKANAKKVFDGALKPLYEKYHKPIIIYSIAFPSVDGGMNGSIDVFDPSIVVWGPYSGKYKLDVKEQAEGYEAFMGAVAETPYITGTYPFHFVPLLQPTSKDYNIRGKPAEKVVAGWYKGIEEQEK